MKLRKSPSLRQRYHGGLLGLAVLDALGTTIEFSPPGSFEPLTDIVGGGPFKLQPGQWTDDMSMALCLAESLLFRRGFNPVDQLERYVDWHENGHWSSTGVCFDIGNTVKAALVKFKETGEPYCGSTDKFSAGNGSIMRLIAVPLYFARDLADAIEKAGLSSRTTHQHPASIDACRYMASLILGCLRGASKEELLSPNYCVIDGYWEEHPLVPEIAAIAAGSFKELEPPEIKGSGYVVKSLEAALWAFHRSNSFKEGGLMAVNLGDDADTTGAVFGQIAGAYYGKSGIPKSWLQKLAMRQEIESIAQLLFGVSGK